MARVTQRHPAPSACTRAARTPGRTRPADIIELIMADHRRIRRLSQALEDAARYRDGPDWVLTAAWQQLATLLEVHTLAEEEICYLPMFGSGPRGTERMQDARACNADIREAICEASLRCAGSPPWWRAVRATLAAAAEHLDREQHIARSGWVLRLTASRRRELGRQWSALTAAWRQDCSSSRHEPGDVAGSSR